LVFRSDYYSFGSMDRKVVLLLTLILSLASPPSLPCQTMENQAISIDSAITVTGGMLSRGMVEQAGSRIDSLMKLIYGGENNITLLTQLKFRSLQGRMLLQRSRLEEWTNLYSWCKSEEINCKSEDEINLLVRLFNNAGIAFKRLGRLQESEEAFLKSCDALRKLNNPDFSIFGSVYANAGNSLKQMGEYARAIEYLENSIHYFDQYVELAKMPNAVSRIADPKSKALDNLGLVYQSLGNHAKAIEVFKSCIDLKLMYYPAGLANVYGNLVISLTEMKEYDAALNTISLILDPYAKGMVRDRNWALARLNQIDIAHRVNSNDKSFFMDVDRLIKIIRTEIPDALDIIAVANQLAATSLINSARYEAALNYLADALSSISVADQKFTPMDIPYDIQTYNINKLIELMDLNSKTFYVWGIQTRDIHKYKMAEERYSFTLKLIDSLRNSLELHSSKLQVSKMQQSAYHQMIELEYKIFRLTRDSSYLGRIFTAMEQSKSAGLWSSVTNMDVKNRKIPAEELEVENNIRRKIADIQGQIIEASAGQAFDPKTVRALQQENLLYNQKIDSLKQVFRQKYPDYYQSKFDQSTLTMEQVSGLLKPGQTLIEYTIAFDQLYTLTISQAGVTVTQVPVTGNQRRTWRSCWNS
jgi:tetratricopeptide (TPR) repeat protein